MSRATAIKELQSISRQLEVLKASTFGPAMKARIRQNLQAKLEAFLVEAIDKSAYLGDTRIAVLFDEINDSINEVNR